MNEHEICLSYKQAKDPAKQIKILAELNLCKPEVITEILSRNGLITGTPGAKKKRAANIDWTIMDKEVSKLAEQGLKVPEIAERLGIDKRKIYDRRSYFNKLARNIKMKKPSAQKAEKTKPIEVPKRSVDYESVQTAVQLLKDSGFTVECANLDFLNKSFSIRGKAEE